MEINYDHAAFISHLRYLQALNVLHVRGRVEKDDYKAQMYYLLDPRKGGTGKLREMLRVLKIATVDELRSFLRDYDIDPKDFSYAESLMVGSNAIMSSSMSQGQKIVRQAIKDGKILPFYGHLLSLQQTLQISSCMSLENILNSVSEARDAAQEAMGTNWQGYIELDKIYRDIVQRLEKIGPAGPKLFPIDLAEEYTTIISGVRQDMEEGKF